MNTYNIYKKRDGQSFKLFSHILANSFEEAQKEFAINMTQENWEKSNNIVWLDAYANGVEQTGWYNLDGSILVEGGENDEPDYGNSQMELFVSEAAIIDGFSSWTEDVYTWEIRNFQDYTEIYDIGDFNEEKENYAYFMAVDGERFFLYNGDFSDISQTEGFGSYSSKDDKFMGSKVNDFEFIENFLN